MSEPILTRRSFVRGSAAALLASGLPLPVWTRAAHSAQQMRGAPLLAVIFLRGAADGLHLVPPIGDRRYASLRDGDLRLDTTLPFGAGFGLHPAFEPLQFLVDRGEVAVVHAAGSPDPTRSHFDAQDFMEAGTPGGYAKDGWMARALGPTTGDALFSRVAITSGLPWSLRGSRALALSDPARLSLGTLPASERRRLARSYEDGDDSDPVVAAGRRALAAAEQLRSLPSPEPDRRAGRRRRGRDRLALSLRSRVETLRELSAAGNAIDAVFLDVGEWDTHANQGGSEGRMANRIRDLAEGMAALYRAFESERTVHCLVMTEFGRTVRPNGTGGTDHGHGSALLVTGPGVRGGMVGDWRGLDPAALHEGRDLPVQNDYRDVASEVLRAHTGRPVGAAVFPGHRSTSLGLFV